MKKNLNSSLLIASLVGCNSVFSAENPMMQKEKPNVLFLFVDDMTYNGLNILGNDEIISPNLDSLISRGVRFTNAYIMGGWNGAISIASRSQLITGSYLWNTHNAEKEHFERNYNNRSLWPQMMKDNGYKTFQTGKWHMNYIGAKDVFDEAVKVRGGMPHSVNVAYNRPINEQDCLWLPWDTSYGGYWEGGKHWSEVLADETIKYIEKNSDSKQPLFMFCSFNAPHDPRQSPREYVEMYDIDKIKIPDNFLPLHPFADEMGCGKDLRDEALAPFPRSFFSVQKHRQEYYALITHLDVQIGRILRSLHDNNMDKNTLIIFAADNGLSVGNHGLMGKQSMYDHSVKVPLVFCGLDLPQGEKRSQLVYLQDLVPTLYDMLGIQLPEDMDFVSQKQILYNEKAKSKREYIYSAYLEDTQRMITDGRYKLFFIPKANRILLFDLKKDPMEKKNLFGIKKYDKAVKNLLEGYIVLSEEAGDKFNLEDYFPDLFRKYLGSR